MARAQAVAGQIAYFRVYPEPGISRLYFTVRIFQSSNTMRRYLRRRRVGPARVGRRCRGICSGWTISDRRHGCWRARPHIGEIVYLRRWLGARVLSHECAHAMFVWARRRRVDITDMGHGRFIEGGEERACGVLGDLMRQISIQVWDRGLAK